MLIPERERKSFGSSLRKEEKKRIQVKVFNISEIKEGKGNGNNKREISYFDIFSCYFSQTSFSKLFYSFRFNKHLTSIQQTFHKHHFDRYMSWSYMSWTYMSVPERNIVYRAKHMQ